MKNSNKESAFTLAEVLITLAVIGIVAAMTIPTLISNYQKTAYVTGIKKAYSQVNQALTMMTNDNGTPGDLHASGLFASGGATSRLTLGAEFTKYLKIAKNCGTTGEGNCWADLTYYNFDSDAAGGTTNYNQDGSYTFLTADGMSFSINNFANDCIYDRSTGYSGNLKEVCGEVFIDTNGLKGPNCFGRDVFQFFISNGKGAMLYPRGGSDDVDRGWNSFIPGWYCSETASNKSGMFCGGAIMENGWQMLY